MKRMPHINLPEDLGIRYALLPGDPARVDRIAAYLTDTSDLGMNREYRSVSGFYQGIPVLAMSTGMGGPSTAIAIEELKQIGITAVIRVGSCGSLQPDTVTGDLVLVNGAVRDEGTSKGYAPAEYPAIPDFHLLAACLESARALGYRHTIGITRSHDCLYGEENADAVEKWGSRRVTASEQETAALFVTAMLRGIRAASVLNVVADCRKDIQADIADYANGGQTAADGEKHSILTALEAIKRIKQYEEDFSHETI